MVSGNQKIEKKCEKCGSSDWEKQFTKRMGVVFKGSGFYITDSRKGSSATFTSDSSPGGSSTSGTGSATPAPSSSDSAAPAAAARDD